MTCAHNGRAIGEVFERCLLCKRWPIAPAERPEMEDFRAWLRKTA